MYAETPCPYSLIPYTDPHSGGVWCEVSWTWHATGTTDAAVGDYLHVEHGIPVLRCGIYEAAAQLDLPEPWFTDEFVLNVSAKVDRQLRLRPLAELRCPDGVLQIRLTAPRG